jgi:hypothetical protein
MYRFIGLNLGMVMHLSMSSRRMGRRILTETNIFCQKSSPGHYFLVRIPWVYINWGKIISDMYFPFVRLPPPLGMGLGCFIRIEVVGQVSYVRILGLPALPPPD